MTETAEYVGRLNWNAAANVAIVPGAVLPYELPLGDEGETIFEPVTIFAIRESGQFGPLNEGKLRSLLEHYLDNPRISISHVIQHYTDDVTGLKKQLSNLRNRINQIITTEKERSDFLKKRIKDLQKALEERTEMPVFIPQQLQLTNAAKEAFLNVGLYPLTESELLHFIYTGVFNTQVSVDILIRQLKFLHLRIYYNEENERNSFQLLRDKILYAIEDVNRQLIQHGII